MSRDLMNWWLVRVRRVTRHLRAQSSWKTRESRSMKQDQMRFFSIIIIIITHTIEISSFAFWVYTFRSRVVWSVIVDPWNLQVRAKTFKRRTKTEVYLLSSQNQHKNAIKSIRKSQFCPYTFKKFSGICNVIRLIWDHFSFIFSSSLLLSTCKIQ